MTLQEKAQLAEKTAREVGRMLVSRRDFEVRHKAENDFVTEMDVKSENMIREALLTACPEDEFYGEESGGSEKADGRWIVDPIDGTTNYIKDIPLYNISIAYESKGELVIGCVYLPALDELYLAVKGQGATCNGKPIHVSDVSDPGDAVFSMSFAHRIEEHHRLMLDVLDKIMGTCSDLRRFGAAASDLCFVACGRVDGYFELGLNLYDIAAGVVILQEAGGMLTGWADGDDPLVGCNVCASNGKLHPYLRSKLHL